MSNKVDLSQIKKGKKISVFEREPNRVVTGTTKKNTGRPVKKETEKLTKSITVNLTEAEYEKLVEKQESFEVRVSLPSLVRGLLKKHGDI